MVRRVDDEIFGQGQTDLVNDLFAEIYIQHNPTLPNGRQGLIDFVSFLKSLDPVPVITVKHILADGDLVAVPVRLIRILSFSPDLVAAAIAAHCQRSTFARVLRISLSGTLVSRIGR